MKGKSREKLKIASSLTMCLVCLFCIFAATFAWFAQNKNVGASGLQIGLGTEDGILGCEYFNVSTTDEAGYFFEKVDSTAAKLGNYSIIGNKKHQLLMKIYLPETIEQLTVTAITSTSYFLGNDGYTLLPTANGATKPGTGTAANGAEYTNVLSSIVGIMALQKGEIGQNGTGYTMTKIPENRLKTFINASNEVQDFSIIQNENAPENTVIETQPDQYGGADCRSFFLLIDYDPLLVATVFSKNIGNDVVTGTGAKEILFVCDFELELQAD